MDVLTIANRLTTSVFGTKSDDDFSDRLNYRYTVGLLILFSIIISGRLYGSEVTFIMLNDICPYGKNKEQIILR